MLCAKTLLAVARELRSSAKTQAKLARRDARAAWYGSAVFWDNCATTLAHWAEHFEGKALSYKKPGRRITKRAKP